jgi:hypothetical protein
MSAIRSAIGGGNLVEFFPLTTANALGAKSAHIEDKTKSTKVTGHPIKKTLTIDLDARHGDMTFETFLSSYLYDGEVTPVIEKYEDSSQDSSTVVPSSKYLGYVLYFGANGSSRKVLYGVGVLSGATGDATTGENALEQTPVQITAVVNPSTAAITFASTIWNTDKVTSTVAGSLPTGSYGVYTTLAAK